MCVGVSVLLSLSPVFLPSGELAASGCEREALQGVFGTGQFVASVCLLGACLVLLCAEPCLMPDAMEVCLLFQQRGGR